MNKQAIFTGANSVQVDTALDALDFCNVDRWA